MAKYIVRGACGHDVPVDVFGTEEDRIWKLDHWYFGRVTCDECKKKKRAEFVERAKEYGLPPLTGTDKQISWAEAIRASGYEYLTNQIQTRIKGSEKGLYRIGYEYGKNGTTETARGSMDARIETFMNSVAIEEEKLKMVDRYFGYYTKASYWIEHQYLLDERHLLEWAEKHTPEIEENRVFEKEVQESLTITPENVVKQDRVTLKVSGNIIIAEYAKDADFIAIVKGLGYMWSGYDWRNKYPEVTGSIVDREAEIGHELLENGFVVTFSTAEAMEKAVSGEYEDAKTRFILKSDDSHLLISWIGKDDKMYRAGKELKSAKYDGNQHGFIVKASYYQDIEGLIDYMGMAVSEAAKAILQAEKDKVLKADLTKIEAHKSKKASEEAKLDEILQSSREVLVDLVEDED